MELRFSFHETPPPSSRQRESPRAVFPATINTLLCYGRSANEILVAELLSQRSVRQLLAFRPVRTLIESNHARCAEAIDVPRLLSLFGKVRFISGVWSLRGSKSRQLTSSHGLRTSRLVVCTASPSPSTDPKRNVHATPLWHASFPTKIRSPSFPELPTQLRLRVRPFAHPRKPPPISCVAQITLAA